MRIVFYCQQWSLLRIYNWWIHERSSRSNFFHFHAVFGGNLTTSTQWLHPTPPPRPREILDPPVCWADSVGYSQVLYLQRYSPTAQFTKPPAPQLPSVPKKLLAGMPPEIVPVAGYHSQPMGHFSVGQWKDGIVPVKSWNDREPWGWRLCE